MGLIAFALVASHTSLVSAARVSPRFIEIPAGSLSQSIRRLSDWTGVRLAPPGSYRTSPYAGFVRQRHREMR